MAKADPQRLAAWALLHRAHHVVQRQLEVALIEERDLPLAWFEVLDALRSSKGALRAAELAKRTATKSSTLTRQLDQLESNGYITRERRVGDDARVVMVVLTREGRDVWRRASSTYTRVVNRSIAADLSDEDILALQRIAGGVLAAD